MKTNFKYEPKDIPDLYNFLFKINYDNSINGYNEANMLWQIQKLLKLYGHFN
jgi:hypothetical protein